MPGYEKELENGFVQLLNAHYYICLSRRSLPPPSLPSSLKPSSLPQTSSLPQAIFPPTNLLPPSSHLPSLPPSSHLPSLPPSSHLPSSLPQAIFPLLPSTISRVISSGGGSNSLECDMWRAGESAESNKCMSEMGFFLTHYDRSKL